MPALGRRPGNPDTRNVLLQTARALFAEAGYSHTSVRDIAAAAGVDPAMIRHYFGSKAELFRATMGWPFGPEQVAAQIASGEGGDIGARLTKVFFGAWEDAETRAPLLAILRGAATHEESATLVRQFIQTQLYPQIAAVLDDPKAELRVDLAMGQLLGIAFLRHVLCIEPIASTPTKELVEWVASVISLHLDGR